MRCCIVHGYTGTRVQDTHSESEYKDSGLTWGTWDTDYWILVTGYYILSPVLSDFFKVIAIHHIHAYVRISHIYVLHL